MYVVCVYIYIYIYIYMYVCMYVCMYICTYVCMYVYMYVYTYVCMYLCMYVTVIAHVNTLRYKIWSRYIVLLYHIAKGWNLTLMQRSRSNRPYLDWNDKYNSILLSKSNNKIKIIDSRFNIRIII